MNGTECTVQVMTKLGRLYSEMIFVQGYIHCDPHPGNLLVRPSTSGTEIVLLDHGLYQVHSYVCFAGVVLLAEHLTSQLLFLTSGIQLSLLYFCKVKSETYSYSLKCGVTN